jgi:hypothetical protein
VGRAEPVGDDALAAEHARAPEDDRAVVTIVLVEDHAVTFPVQQIGQGVFALLDRRPAGAPAETFSASRFKFARLSR